MSDLFEITADRLAAGGAGVGRRDGKVMFIDGAYPGDHVKARITKEKKNWAKAQVVEILDPSTDRVGPPCPHANECGGCPWMGLSYETQLDWKRTIAKETIERIGGIEIDIEPVIPSPKNLGYRSRVRLALTSGDRPRLGYRKKGSHDIAPINACPVADESVNATIKSLGEIVADHPEQAALIDEVLIESGTSNNSKTRVTIYVKPNFPDGFEEEIFAGLSNVSSVIKEQAGRLVVTGDPVLDVSSPDGAKYTLSPGSFCQINMAQNEALVKIVAEAANLGEGKRGLDLYCGAGNYTIPLAKAGAAMTGVDSVRGNVNDAETNAAKNGVITAAFLTEEARKALQKMRENKELFDTVILNPPRAGAPGLAGDICSVASERIVYVSCDPASFARDAKSFGEHGFSLSEITLLDLFPHTPHIESVALFLKK